MLDHRALVTGVRAGKLARRKLQHAEPHRDEHGLAVHRADCLVRRLEHARGAVEALGGILGDDHRGHHEQGRWDALAAHIGNHERKMVMVDEEEIVEVAADLLGGIHAREELELGALGEGRKDVGQHVGLDARREVELGADALAIGRDGLDLAHVIVDLVRKADHILRELADLVAPDRDGTSALEHRGKIACDRVAVLGRRVHADVAKNVLEGAEQVDAHVPHDEEEQERLENRGDHRALERLRIDPGMDLREVVGHAHQHRLVADLIDVGVVIGEGAARSHIGVGLLLSRAVTLAGTCVIDGCVHRVLQALVDLRHRAEQIEVAVLVAAGGILVRAADDEELRRIGVLARRGGGHDDVEEIDVVVALDLVDAVGQPRVDDLGVELLVGRRQAPDVVARHVFDLHAGVVAGKLDALLLGDGIAPEIHVVLDVHLVGMVVPVAQQPPVRRIFLNGIDDLVGDVGGDLAHIAIDVRLGDVALHQVGKDDGDDQTDRHQQIDLPVDTLPARRFRSACLTRAQGVTCSPS